MLAVPFASAASAAPHYVKGDFDGDGPVDLAVGAPGANPESHRAAYDLAQALASADINGGYADLAATLLGIDDGNIRVWYGSPTGFNAAGFQPLGGRCQTMTYCAAPGHLLATAPFNTTLLDDYEATSLAFGDVDTPS
jgi:hypothetical protein